MSPGKYIRFGDASMLSLKSTGYLTQKKKAAYLPPSINTFSLAIHCDSSLGE